MYKILEIVTSNAKFIARRDGSEYVTNCALLILKYNALKLNNPTLFFRVL